MWFYQVKPAMRIVRCEAIRSLALLIVTLSLAAVVSAASFTVTKIADTNDGVCDADCSLREAIAAANAASSNDIIDFSSAVFNTPQTITLGGTELAIANNGTLQLNGPGAELLTVSGNTASRVMKVNAGATVSLTGIRIANGKLLNNDWGAGILNAGNLTVTSSVVVNNNSASNGGGIFNDGAASTLLLTNTTVSGNIGNGGGVYNFNGTATINNCQITNNTGSNGAGVLNVNGPLNLNGTTINLNSAVGGGQGGGLYNSNGNVTASATTVNGNTGIGGAGGIHTSGGSITMENSSITNNQSSNGDGAGISTTQGGGISLTGSTVSGNIACSGCRGGGISAWGSTTTVTLTRVTINNNSALAGGGVFLENQATLNIYDSTIRNNSANTGGGVFVSGGTANIVNATITANAANGPFGGGGGITLGSAAVSLTNVTIAGNSSVGPESGGGIRNGSGTASGAVLALNTIIANNTSNVANGQDVSGSIGSLGYNLIETTAGATITGNQTGNIFGKDPELLPLGNYGGPTETMALHPASPAIDSANPANFSTTDQRLIPRAQDGDLNGSVLPDIGAYERRLTVFMVTKTADTNDGVCDSDCSLREAVVRANADANIDHGIAFDPNLFDSPQTITLTGGELNIDADGTMLVKGRGRDLLTLSGNNASRIFFIDSGASAAIRDVTIANGKAAFSNGGCVHNALGRLTLASTTIRNCESGNGGAVKNEGGILSIVDSVLNNNLATTSGGAISSSDWAQFRAALTIENSTLRSNTAMHSGGAVDNSSQGTLVIKNSAFETNTVTGSSNSGGGIRTSNTIVTIIESTFTGNTSTDGGGGIRIDGSDSRLTVSLSTFRNNSSPYGGGIRIDAGIATISDSTFSFNTAIGRGAGMVTQVGTTVTVTGSTFNDNTANDDGGGIACFGTFTMTNSTVTNNRANDTGGGIYNGNIATVSYSTISNNQANHGGGVVNGGTFTARGIIVGDNTANTTTKDFASTLTSQGFNLIENSTGATITGTTTGNLIGQDPRLGPLRNNGGPTLTRALLPGSPAIDAGDSGTFPPIDQRSVTRPKDGDRNVSVLPDMGAYERDPVIDNKAPFDFDGDGRTDIGIFRPSVAEWWINRSSTGVTFAAQFGAATDSLVPGDYTGDGKADIAVRRPATGEWFILRSEDFSYYSFPFGTNDDVEVPADYDGDGKTDAAVYRPTTFTWYVRRSGDGGTTIQQFGAAGDVAVPSDYDGDGKTDIAIFRPSVGQWWMNRSSAGVLAVTFGSSTDKLVQGDYTGDGKSDNAIWRPSTGEWFVLRSEDFSFYSFPFGTNGDVPAPGDYDGDSRFDATVFRPTTSTWFVQRTTAGTLIQTFGTSGDRAVPSVFVP